MSAMITAWNHVKPTRKRKRARHTASGSAPPEGMRSHSRLGRDTIFTGPPVSKGGAERATAR